MCFRIHFLHIFARLPWLQVEIVIRTG
jgi:hypothetical protein